MSERTLRNIANVFLVAGGSFMFFSNHPHMSLIVIATVLIFFAIAIHAFFDFKKIRR